MRVRFKNRFSKSSRHLHSRASTLCAKVSLKSKFEAQWMEPLGIKDAVVCPKEHWIITKSFIEKGPLV